MSLDISKPFASTLVHRKALEATEYLAMKDAMNNGASCRSCKYFLQKQYVGFCKMTSKTVQNYNICTAYRKLEIGEKK